MNGSLNANGIDTKKIEIEIEIVYVSDGGYDGGDDDGDYLNDDEFCFPTIINFQKWKPCDDFLLFVSLGAKLTLVN